MKAPVIPNDGNRGDPDHVELWGDEPPTKPDRRASKEPGHGREAELHESTVGRDEAKAVDRIQSGGGKRHASRESLPPATLRYSWNIDQSEPYFMGSSYSSAASTISASPPEGESANS